MAARKLTKAEKLVQEQMLALLERAADRPKFWHSLGRHATGDATGGRVARQAWRDRDR
jgi:hypothetical protein